MDMQELGKHTSADVKRKEHIMAEERKTEFAGSGVITKCPNCGAQIEAFQARCPACGFAISGVEEGGSAALKNFLDKYKKLETYWKKADMVKTFPLPNTVEDIIEFTLFASQQIRAISRETEISDRHINLCAAWSAKLEEARARAGLSFPKDDPRQANFEALIADSMKNVELVNTMVAKKKRRTKLYIGIALFVFFGPGIITAICYGLYFSIAPRIETRRLEKLQTEIQYNISAGDYTAAELELAEFKWTYDFNDKDKNQTHVNRWAEKRATLQKQLEEAKKSKK